MRRFLAAAFAIFGFVSSAHAQALSPLGPGDIFTATASGQNGGISLSQSQIPTYNNCFWSDTDNCAPVNVRQRERLFIGNAVAGDNSRNNFPVNTWWQSLPTNQQGSYYLLRDAQVASMTDRGSIAISGMALSSQGDGLGAGLKPAPIGLAGYVNNNTSLNNQSAWAGYTECIHAPTGTGGFCFGIESDVRNTTTTNFAPNPYSMGQGDYSLWAAAGAGVGVSGGALNPSAAALAIVSNQQTFNSGIVFQNGALTADGSGNSKAIQLPQRAAVQWYANANAIGAQIRSDVDTLGDDMSILFADNQINFAGPSGTNLVRVNTSPSNSVPSLAFLSCGASCGFFAPTTNQLVMDAGDAAGGSPGPVWDYGQSGVGVLSMRVTFSLAAQALTLAGNITSNAGTGFELANLAPSSTAPSLIPNRASTTTGFGSQATGNISTIVGGVETVRFPSSGELLVSATPTAVASQVGIGNTTAAASSCGSLASAAGCLVINVGGTTRNIPYY